MDNQKDSLNGRAGNCAENLSKGHSDYKAEYCSEENTADNGSSRPGGGSENRIKGSPKNWQSGGPDRNDFIVIRKPGKKTVKRIAAAAAALALLLAGAEAAEELLEFHIARTEDAAAEKMLRARAEAGNVPLISREEAVLTALRLAEASEQDVKKLDVKLDSDSGRSLDGRSLSYIYEVGFIYNGFEYDLDIDAVSGWVVSSDVESAAD